MNFTCERCGCAPDAEEQERIRTDLAAHSGSPVGWICMKCEPDLKLAPSGLRFGVVTVVGSSPPHEYEQTPGILLARPGSDGS